MTPEFMAQLDELESLIDAIARLDAEGGYVRVTRAEAEAARDALEAIEDWLGRDSSGTVVEMPRRS